MSRGNTALIAGATGVVGRNLLQHLDGLPDWDVVGISRHEPDFEGGFRHVPADLLDARDCRAKLGGLHDVTHLFHAAYLEGPSWEETSAPNVAMLTNLLDAIEPAAKELRHVHLVQGTKYYGSHLGPFKTPAKESDPRLTAPNFYYDLEDLVIARQAGKAWAWSACRPHAICGFSVGNPMNLTMVIAVYASICKELGLPLSHPGTAGNYRALYQCTDAGLLARAMVWMATDPGCANEAFNVINGDYIRWQTLWPRFAAYFGMEPGPPQEMKLTDMMADKAPVWERIVAKYGLVPYKFDEIAAWPFGDFVFASEYDIMSDMTKARQYGFCEAVDTEEMFFRLFDDFRAAKVIP